MVKTRRTVPLSRERILDAAEDLVAREGLGAVSMRRVAAELGTGAMSLYNHVPSKEALLVGLAERVLAQVRMPEVAGRRELAASWARSVRRTLIDNRQMLPLLFTLPRRTMLAGLARSLTDALTAAGMPSDSAREVTSVLGRYVAGALVFDGAASRRADADHESLDRTFERGLEALLAGLGPLLTPDT